MQRQLGQELQTPAQSDQPRNSPPSCPGNNGCEGQESVSTMTAPAAVRWGYFGFRRTRRWRRFRLACFDAKPALSGLSWYTCECFVISWTAKLPRNGRASRRGQVPSVAASGAAPGENRRRGSPPSALSASCASAERRRNRCPREATQCGSPRSKEGRALNTGGTSPRSLGFSAPALISQRRNARSGAIIDSRMKAARAAKVSAAVT